MTMGIRRMPDEDWLVIDNLYKAEQQIRTHLLETNHDGVLQCLPESKEACKEALDCIVNFLIRRYPKHFWLLEDKPGYVHNAITSKTFRFIEPYDQDPLAIAAQLAMEDINLLMQGTGENSNNYFLCVSKMCVTAKKNADEKLQTSNLFNGTSWMVHSAAYRLAIMEDTWASTVVESEVEKVNGKVLFPTSRFLLYDNPDLARFFLGLKVSSPVQRNNYFVQIDDTMFQQEPFADSTELPPRIEDIRIRSERQTLRRLPRTGAIMFLVRTYLIPITELENELDNLYSLRSAINAWPAEIAKYKGRHVWHETFERWCDEVLGDYVPTSG
ncbi:hypothetical protein ACEPPN_009897 [Leptodophora sp. 'Broadleaf-Isolate-01']